MKCATVVVILVLLVMAAIYLPFLLGLDEYFEDGEE
jgi:cellobiose-specific phosphotransferase system component IIC